MADNVELVRRLWQAFDRGGIEAVLEIADPGVEWEPYGGGGVVYHGHDGLRAYMRSRTDQNQQTQARLYSAVARGDTVVARGEVQISSEGGIVTMQPGWLYEFREGKLVRFRGFPSLEAAMREAGMAPRDAPSIVREAWAAFNRGGIERMLDLVHDDAEWHTYRGARGVYRGHEGIREYFREVAGDGSHVGVTEYAVREIGGAVIMSGSLQVVARSGAVSQQQVHWVYWVRDARIARAASFARREQALAAAQGAGAPG